MLAATNLDDYRTALLRKSYARRIVEIRDRVQELNPTPLCAKVADHLFKSFGNQAILVHVHVDNFALVRAERAERAHIRGSLRQHDVALLQENLRNQIQSLLRTGGDNYIIRICINTVIRHHLSDALAKILPPLARAVLHSLRAVTRNERASRLSQRIQRQILNVWHASSQRHYFWPRNHGKQSADF